MQLVQVVLGAEIDYQTAVKLSNFVLERRMREERGSSRRVPQGGTEKIRKKGALYRDWSGSLRAR